MGEDKPAVTHSVQPAFVTAKRKIHNTEAVGVSLASFPFDEKSAAVHYEEWAVTGFSGHGLTLLLCFWHWMERIREVRDIFLHVS